MVLLMLAGLETLRRGGSQFASGMVPFENKAVKRKYKKHGATVIGTGNMMAVRL